MAAALRPGQYADRWFDIAKLPGSNLKLYVSVEILDEVRRKLVNSFGFKESEVLQLIGRIKSAANMVKPSVHLSVITDDPDANRIVECALKARAHLIVSADHYLLNLGQYKSMRITHPRELKRIFATDFKETDNHTR